MRSFYSSIIVSIYLILGTSSGLTQDKNPQSIPDLSLEFRSHYGFIVRHHPEMNVLTDSHFPAFEVNLSKQTYGKKMWEQFYDYPETGISYWQCSFGGSDVMGSAIALYPYIRFPLLRQNRFGLHFRFGVGLGLFSKKFERFENYKNLAIGSSLNAAINFMVDAKYIISNRFRVSSGISLTHFSSGAMAMPNYGINIPMINLGLAYRLTNFERNYIREELPEHDRSWDYLLIASFGVKEISAIDSKKYLVYNISADALKPLSLRFKLGGGLDLFYDNSKVHSLEQRGIYETKIKSNLGIGAHFTYEQTISHVAILIEAGSYLYSEHNIDGNIFEKLLINYIINQRLLASISLKAHFGKADYITWGMGWKL